jgi:hypothetical protein
MRPLDIVKIETGAVGVITEMSGGMASIRWFGRAENKVAWWSTGERGLEVIDNLASFMTEAMRHPFSSGRVNPYIKP